MYAVVVPYAKQVTAVLAEQNKSQLSRLGLHYHAAQQHQPAACGYCTRRVEIDRALAVLDGFKISRFHDFKISSRKNLIFVPKGLLFAVFCACWEKKKKFGGRCKLPNLFKPATDRETSAVQKRRTAYSPQNI